MNRKVVLNCIIIILILACIPFGIKKEDTSSIQKGKSISYYKALVWQYDYYCDAMYNDGSYTIVKKISFFFTVPFFEESQRMKLNTNGELEFWYNPEVVKEIEPAS